jgi:FkbM family methyltransferase
MFRLFREMLKPARDYMRDNGYREWLRVKSACRKAGNGPVTVNVAGFEISGPNASALLHQYEEIFRKHSFDIPFDRQAPEILICGANIGIEIFYFKSLYPEARIHAYEADPEIAGILAENVKRNKLEHVETISAAVWTGNGTLAFQPDGHLGGRAGFGSLQVPSVRLSDILKKISWIDLLTVDIEGSELAVLRDCKDQLAHVDHLFVEWHGHENQQQELNELLLLLNNAGFRYRLNNNLPRAPFKNRLVESGFDAMVEIYCSR